MGTKERRERERSEVRQRILSAARELFAAHGYDAVTMRKVAEAIEYSATAIYHHFADKESLLRDLCSEDFLTLAKAFQKIAREPDPLVRLRKTGLAYADFGLTHPNHYRLMFMTPRPQVPADERILEKGNPEQDAYAFLKNTVEEAISRGMLRPEYRDADVVAQALWAATHGVISLHMAVGDDPWIDFRPARKLAAIQIDLLIRGLANPELLSPPETPTA